ncbi:hypothetical protein ACGFNU_49515 [Spirillospora sp. NPDC048911]|uniref:hypothetical protein n=1 Tax=Spirillospora sp. NPDC048911 TaxID=3364527 RepID=UPI00371DB45B
MRGRVGLAAAAALVCLTGCAGPSRTDGDFTAKAANTAEAAVSSVRTARIAVQAAVDGKAPARYLSVVFSDQETALTSVQSTFDSVQPPSSAADDLRDGLDELLTEAVDQVAQLRIDSRRGGFRPDRATLQALDAIADRLDRFAEEHS